LGVKRKLGIHAVLPREGEVLLPAEQVTSHRSGDFRPFLREQLRAGDIRESQARLFGPRHRAVRASGRGYGQ
jgi:hypothetical protein